MSDFSQGDGWWQASDGKWYPPEAHPNRTAANSATSSKPQNPWRRFRGWPLWAQIVSWVAVGFIVLLVIGGRAGGSTKASNVATITPTESPTIPLPTSAPTTVPPTTPATTVPSTTTATTTPPTTTPRVPPSTTALAGLATLPIKGRAPKTGYSRAQFGPAWSDDVTVADGGNGCDTRNDILRRDLTDIVTKTGTLGCIVASGILHDPYTNTVIRFTRGAGTSTIVQIDHVVALGDAWQTGAQQLSMSVRINFANDPLNLLAVSGAANQQKGDADAASWLPPNKAFRCQYVAIQVAVKMRYHLWVTSAEHQAIAGVLSTCPTQPLPAGGTPARISPTPVAPPPGPIPTPAPVPAPVPTTTHPPPPSTVAPNVRIVTRGPSARPLELEGSPRPAHP